MLFKCPFEVAIGIGIEHGGIIVLFDSDPDLDLDLDRVSAGYDLSIPERHAFTLEAAIHSI
jgi:hypothetical protein